MNYCKKMNRPCTCGKLFLYDRQGRVQTQDSAAGCLSDAEIRDTLTVMLQEWRRRCDVEQARTLHQTWH